MKTYKISICNEDSELLDQIEVEALDITPPGTVSNQIVDLICMANRNITRICYFKA